MLPRHHTILRFVLLCLALVSSPSLFAQAPASLAGTWQGTLNTGDSHLRVVLVLNQSPAGTWSATAYSPDQGPDPMRANTVTVEAGHLHFAIADIGGSYDGALQSGGATIKGNWTQGQPLPLDFSRATAQTKWVIDSSSHKSSFVTVAPDVRLEVLDWGGTGRPLVLLSGLGNSAHVFDQFAPKLTPGFHVFGITRRGFGQSSVPSPSDPANYTVDRLGDDVLAVIAALHLSKPILAGHSIAGEELSDIANRHPEAVSGLVYLDAGYPYALYDPARGDINLDILDLRRKIDLVIPGSGVPNTLPLLKEIQADLPRFNNDLANEQQQLSLFPHPPADAPSTAPVPPPPLTPGAAIILGEQKFSRIPLPTLAIFAVPHDFKLLYPKDPQAFAAVRAFDETRMVAIADHFAQAVPTARVVRLKDADHYLFKSNEADVLREINAFAATLPPPTIP